MCWHLCPRACVLGDCSKMQFWRYFSLLPFLAPASQSRMLITGGCWCSTAFFLSTTCQMPSDRHYQSQRSHQIWGNLGGSCAEGVFTLWNSFQNSALHCGKHSEGLFGFLKILNRLFLLVLELAKVPGRNSMRLLQGSPLYRRRCMPTHRLSSCAPGEHGFHWQINSGNFSICRTKLTSV